MRSSTDNLFSNTFRKSSSGFSEWNKAESTIYKQLESFLSSKEASQSYLFGRWVFLPIRECRAGGLLHPREARTPNIGAGCISLAIEHNHCWVVVLLGGVADGWFDDPIGLSARAYILIPPIALGKSLLAQSYLVPQLKLLINPQAYVSSPHWLLLSITKPHSHTPLQYINVPAQHTYVSYNDWLPQPWTFVSTGVIPFMTLWLSHEPLMPLSWQRHFNFRRPSDQAS